MSDEFDKEAEREKLRQQLAEEEAKREATQHMSELLLKGATMTNQHCDQCGDPLFRHEGREFCPSCGRQRPADGQEAEEGPADSQAAETGEAPSATAETAEPQAADGTTSGDTTTSTRRSDAGQQHRPRASRGPSEADLPAARDALARKVTALAQQAEATTDVGRARELLAAVREGAEAIRALDGTGR